MKIAVSGSAGTGKSTLCQVLAERLGVASIAENFGPLRGARLKGDFVPKITEIMQKKHALEAAEDHFVSDRCALDLLHIWLIQSCHVIAPEQTAVMLSQCIEQVSGYDYLVLTPWNSFKLEQKPGSLIRNMNPMEQLRFHAAIVGQAHIWMPKQKIIEVPRSMADVNQRVDYVLEEIDRRAYAPV